MTERDSLISSSAWMALGTIVSRLTGFVRGVLIITTLGIGLNADVFTGANTVPNALYILIAGGIFNIILVPALVRAMENDSDNGEAFAQRIITIGLSVLFSATLILMLLVPVIMRIAFDSAVFDPELAAARDSAQFLMLLCMPQVFFYGAFVMIGQVLNSRRRFGPMMWAPIANNVLASAMLITYLVVYGPESSEIGFTRGEELLLGLGSTAGIALQFLVLLPVLKSTGFTMRLRFDWRRTGLRRTAVMSAWAFGFVVVTQIAFFLIQRIGTGATARAAQTGGEGAGATVYQFAYLISQVPHGVITVSVMTAAMPTLASYANAGDHRSMRALMDDTVRLVLVAMVPIALLIGILADAFASLTVSYGAAAGDDGIIGLTVSAFAPAVLFSTMHYMMLRGFYSLENMRTPFYLQLVLASLNIALAFTVVPLVDDKYVAAALAVVFTVTYALGTVMATWLLSRIIGPVIDRDTWIFLARLGFLAVITGVVTFVVSRICQATNVLDHDALVIALGTLAAMGTYLGGAKLLGISEVGDVIRVVARRGRSSPGSS